MGKGREESLDCDSYRDIRSNRTGETINKSSCCASSSSSLGFVPVAVSPFVVAFFITFRSVAFHFAADTRYKLFLHFIHVREYTANKSDCPCARIFLNNILAARQSRRVLSHAPHLFVLFCLLCSYVINVPVEL